MKPRTKRLILIMTGLFLVYGLVFIVFDGLDDVNSGLDAVAYSMTFFSVIMIAVILGTEKND